MGCPNSTEEQPPPSGNNPIMQDKKQRKVITKTWRKLAPYPCLYGVKVFKEIFIRKPEVKKLFIFRDLDGSDLDRNPYFRGHATHFMQAIGAAVDNINDLDRLRPMLLVLGEQHAKTDGFGIDYFQVFTESLLHVWSETLGHHFTPEVRAAWEKMFLFIMVTLCEGYNAKRNGGSGY